MIIIRQRRIAVYAKRGRFIFLLRTVRVIVPYTPHHIIQRGHNRNLDPAYLGLGVGENQRIFRYREFISQGTGRSEQA